MNFPRIKKFKFTLSTTYSIPVQNVGRIDKIAHEIFGNVRFYKPLAYFNDIVLPLGFRAGIRINNDAMRNELIMKGYSGSALDAELLKMQDTIGTTDKDWNYYGDTTFGYISDLYEGRLLAVPDKTSSIIWLNRYEYLT